MTFHIVFKDNERDVFSKGENYPAKDEIQALKTFREEHPRALFLCVYALENLSMLMQGQNDHLIEPPSIDTAP
jgi:hypothetical protein